MSRKRARPGRRVPQGNHRPVGIVAAGPNAIPSWCRGQTAWVVSLSFILLSVALYAPCWRHGFVDHDDLAYIVHDPRIHGGLTWSNIWWAAVSRDYQNWMPVARWSMQLDCSLWGLNPGWHHAMSAFWHGLAGASLAWGLTQLTRRPQFSLVVAAIWLVHPLHVEAVAWAASRKHILAGLFAFLALGSWCRWTQSGKPRWLLATFGALAFGMASKQTMVAWPLWLAFLSYSGVGIDRPARWRRTTWIGLTALTVGAAFMAVWALKGPSHETLPTNPTWQATALAPVSTVRYLLASVAPTGLNFLHRQPSPLPYATILLSFALLALLTWAAWRHRRHQPWVWMGWTWFGVTYAPASGLIPFGPQLWAERFGYAALPGLVMAVGALVLAWKKLPFFPLPIQRSLAAAALVIPAGFTLLQQRYWSDTQSLFDRALAVDPKNVQVRFHLGAWLEKHHRFPEAHLHYQRCVETASGFMPPRYNLACLEMRAGRPQAALAAIQPVAIAHPQWAEAQLVLANACYETGQPEAALAAYEKAAELKPSLTVAAKNAALLRAQLREPVAQP